jgi:hypothetical protein
MRYAECYATLANGRKARLQNTAQFIGWSDHDGKRGYLFRSGRRRVEIRAETEQPGSARKVISWPSLMFGTTDLSFRQHDNPTTGGMQRMRKIVARDGTLLLARRWGQLLARCVGHCGNTHAVTEQAPDGVFGGAQV